jgi:hypothetical protein
LSTGEYDTDHGAAFVVGGTGGVPNCPLGETGTVNVDQLAYGAQGQVTTLGLWFDVVCPLPGTTSTETYRGTVAYNLTPSTPGQGYYVYQRNGALTGFGNDSYLDYLGDLSATKLNRPIVGLAATPDGGGYWLVAADGGIFAFGDAAFEGSLGAAGLGDISGITH